MKQDQSGISRSQKQNLEARAPNGTDKEDSAAQTHVTLCQAATKGLRLCPGLNYTPGFGHRE